MTTINNYKSSTIRGLLKNSDYPDGSEFADAQFDRNLTVNNTIKSRGSIEVSFDNSGAEETIISLQNNGNINCKTITINGADLINQNNNLTINDATINNNLSVINDVYITNNLNVTNDATLSNNLNVNNDVYITNNLNVTNDTTLSNNLNVNNDVIIGNDATINNNLSVINNANIGVNLTTGKLFLNDSDINSQGSNLNLICNNISSFFDVFGNFYCNHNMTLNNDLSVTGSATISNNLTIDNDLTINNNLIVTGGTGNVNCKSISLSGVTLIDSNKDMTVNDLITNKADINSILTVTNVIKPSTTVLPNSSIHLGYIHTINKGSIASVVTTSLSTLQSININNTTFSFGTYRFKLLFSGSGSISQTMTFCINTSQSLYANKNGKQTTNTNISTLQYDITLNIYTTTTVYFLAQTNIGNYTINDAYIEMVRIA
jgi:UDP-3-O-[3-hydroxymyristoyl] glucosamine N-acyltransferase